ncbi:E3 ubiquitin-protein ligase DZIP3-like [Argonauta hians]
MEGQSQQLCSKQIKENLLLLFCSLLHDNGPLSVHSSEFQQVWTSISREQQNVIQSSGGLSKFLRLSQNICWKKPDIFSLKKDIFDDHPLPSSSSSDAQHTPTRIHKSPPPPSHIQTAQNESLSLDNIVLSIFGDVLTSDRNPETPANSSSKQTGTVPAKAIPLSAPQQTSNRQSKTRKNNRKRIKTKEAQTAKANNGKNTEETSEEISQPAPHHAGPSDCQNGGGGSGGGGGGSSKCDSVKPITYSKVASKSIPNNKTRDSSKMVTVTTMMAGATINDDQPLCSICHETLDSNAVNKLTCGHVYHDMCIRKWLDIEKTCPTCRVLVLLNDEYPPLSC